MELLREYQRVHQHVNVPPHATFRGKPLGAWCARQRMAHRQLKQLLLRNPNANLPDMVTQRLKLLEEVHFDFQVQEEENEQTSEQASTKQPATSLEQEQEPVPSSSTAAAEETPSMERSEKPALLPRPKPADDKEEITPQHTTSPEETIKDTHETTTATSTAITTSSSSSKYPRWIEMLNLLRRYKKEHHHVSPARSEIYHTQPLGLWLDDQRQLFQQGELSDRRIDKLSKIGCCLDLASLSQQHKSSHWHEHFGLLQDFCRQHNHHTPTPSEVFCGKLLGPWVAKVRRQYAQLRHGHAPSLDEAHIALLNSIDFPWEAQPSPWDEYLELYLQHRQDTGDAVVHRAIEYKSQGLGKWCHQQRLLYREALSSSRVNRLKDNGFVFDENDDWEEYFSLLMAYRRAYPVCWPTKYEVFLEDSLGNWCDSQRRHRSSLPYDRHSRLSRLGFDFADHFTTMIVLHHECTTNGEIPTVYRGYRLGEWVAYVNKHRASLSPNQSELLVYLGLLPAMQHNYTNRGTPILLRHIEDRIASRAAAAQHRDPSSHEAEPTSSIQNKSPKRAIETAPVEQPTAKMAKVDLDVKQTDSHSVSAEDEIDAQSSSESVDVPPHDNGKHSMRDSGSSTIVVDLPGPHKRTLEIPNYWAMDDDDDDDDFVVRRSCTSQATVVSFF